MKFMSSVIIKYLFPVHLIVLLSVGCGKPVNELSEIDTGCRLNLQTGKIINSSLEYSFKTTKKNLTKDLFNYIYFEGDNLCFSFSFPEGINPTEIKIWFADTTTGGKYPVERFERKGCMIFGHSLIGSLLESFYREKLREKTPDHRYSNRPIKFRIIAEVSGNGLTLKQEKEDSFLINWINE